MIRSLNDLSRAALLQRKGRTVLTGAGVALGVALFFGSVVANASGIGAMDKAIEESAGGVDVVVTPVGDVRQAVIDGTVRRSAEALPGVAAAVGAVVTPTTITTPDGRALEFKVNSGDPAVLFGAEPREVDRMYALRFDAGRQVRAKSDEIVVTSVLARELGLGPGKRATIATPTGDRDVVVSGVLADMGAARYNQGMVVFTSLSWARRAIGETGAVSQILIDLEEGIDVPGWIETHGAELGDSVNVQTFGQATVADFARRQLTAAGAMLNILAVMIMFIAGFLIYLTLSTAVVERVRIYGTLRSLGARRSQIRRIVVSEAFLLGVVSTVTGLVLGLGVAWAIIQVSRRFLLDEMSNTSITVPLWSVFAALALGIATTLGSAFLPARRAARLDPVDAMRGDFAAHVRLSRTWIVGIVSLVVGVSLIGTNRVAWVAVAAPLLLFGAVAIVPLVLRPVAAFTGRVTSLLARGVGKVAVLHLTKERTRSGYTLALVMVVMAAMIAIAATNDSFAHSLDAQISRQFGADLNVSSASTFTPSFVKEVRALDGVEHASPLALAWSKMGTGRDEENALTEFIDPDEYFAIQGFVWRDGNATVAKRALARGGTVIFPIATAERLGLEAGDDVTLKTAAGPRAFEIAATAEISNSVATLYLSWADGERFFGIQQPSELLIKVDPDADVDALRATIEDDLAAPNSLLVTTAEDVRADIRGQITGGLSAFVILLLMAGVLGLFGLANTMAVSMMERYREIGLMRAIGAKKRQVRGMALVESSTLVAVAFLLAIPLGVVLSYPLVELGSKLVGDLTIHYAFPWRVFPVLAIGGAIAAAVAAVGPARRAMQLDIETALRFE